MGRFGHFPLETVKIDNAALKTAFCDKAFNMS